MSTLKDRLEGDPISDEDWEKLRRQARFSLPVQDGASLRGVLLPYQQRLLETTALNQVVVCEKSRRIGMTWAVAADAVLHAGRRRSDGGMDVLYIGYNLDMAREFIDTCGMWARAFEPLATEVTEFLFTETDEKGIAQAIQAFRIRFASGFEIVALTSKPRSLRGRQGYLIFDEAAFHDDLAGMLKAGMAFLIWGGKILIISTHDGKDNPFNEYIQGIRAGKNKGEIVRVTFDEALLDGLYERICLVTGKTWSPEAEAAWRSDIRAFYGADAAEELDAVPGEGEGRLLPLAWIEACTTRDYKVVRWYPEVTNFVDLPAAVRHASMAEFLEEQVGPILACLPPNLRKAFGEDFAMRHDRTAFAVGDVAQDLVRHVPLILELWNCPYEQQLQALRFIGQRLIPLMGAILDANGNGMPLAQQARQEFGAERIVELMPNNEWLREHTAKFRAGFEDRGMLIPADADVTDDLRQFRMVRGVGKIPTSVRNEGGDGMKRHGDAGVALLNFHAATQMEYMEYGYQTPTTADRHDDRWSQSQSEGYWRQGSSGIGRMQDRADDDDTFNGGTW